MVADVSQKGGKKKKKSTREKTIIATRLPDAYEEKLLVDQGNLRFSHHCLGFLGFDVVLLGE
jgi:hypothetical protein